MHSLIMEIIMVSLLKVTLQLLDCLNVLFWLLMASSMTQTILLVSKVEGVKTSRSIKQRDFFTLLLSLNLHTIDTPTWE